MLLMGINRTGFKPKTIGYQHTSITPRHLTLLFELGEAERTPLPTKIVTVGEINRKYLETYGNYPEGIINAGCALRQKWAKPFSRDVGTAMPIRLLLALSSSKKELIKSVMFFMEVKKCLPKLELGIRAHNNFPISLLPETIRDWVPINAIDFTDTALENNLEWCSVTAYISSTVALESLIRGRPIVCFSIGDVISPNPVMGDPSFYWVVNAAKEMVNILSYIHEMPIDEYKKKSSQAIEYVHDYLSSVDKSCLQQFI